MADDFKRITIRSLKDTSTGAYSIADYDRDVRIIERALKSALPEGAFYHKAKEINYNDPTFHQIGKLKDDFYIKEGYTAGAQKAIDEVLAKLTYKGSKVIDPLTGKFSYTQGDVKYWSTRTRPLSDKENELIKELEKLSMKGKDEEGGAEGFRFRKGTMLKIVALITTLTDITRRILSSVLSMATQQVRDTIEAHNLGISREQLREYRRVESAHGLKEGTIAEAIAGEQQKYGNITSLDEKSLEYIALIMGNRVADMATMGLGASNPEAIVSAIVDRANELANAGYNSVGQYVGEQQARRELYSYLLKYSPQIADIFATMQEEQHNINSIFRNQVDTFEKFKNSVGIQRGTTQAGEGVLVSLGQEWNVLKQTLDDIKHVLAVTLAPYLLRILRRLNNMRVGMSESEKLRLNAENRDANEKALKETEASIAFLEQKAGGNVANLSKSEKAYYDTLVQYKKELEEENTKSTIDNIVRTPNEIKAEQERRLTENAKFLTNMLLSGEVDLDDPRYAGAYSFSNDEIMKVVRAQGTGNYGEQALAKFKESYTQRIANQWRNQGKAFSKRELDKYIEDTYRQQFARANFRYFYPKLLNLQTENIINASYNDQVYDIDRAREVWGANFEGLAGALPTSAYGTHKLYSVDVNENGVIVHKLVLDLNDNGVDKGDYTIASWTGNDRGGASGSQAYMTWDRDKGVTVSSSAPSATVQNKLNSDRK